MYIQIFSFKILIFLLPIFIVKCSLYNLATETPSFKDSDRPKQDEGIAYFRFVSSDSIRLPSEIYFREVKNNGKTYHFVISAILTKKESNQYVFLKSGVYNFDNVTYRFAQDVENHGFPSNSFVILPNRINYIGDIIITYLRNHVKISVKDEMNRSMVDFYKEYPKISVEYPLVKSLLKLSSQGIGKDIPILK